MSPVILASDASSHAVRRELASILEECFFKAVFKNSAKMRVLGSDQVNPGPPLVLQSHEACLVMNPTGWLP